jgi:hypothetical protein
MLANLDPQTLRVLERLQLTPEQSRALSRLLMSRLTTDQLAQMNKPPLRRTV